MNLSLRPRSASGPSNKGRKIMQIGAITILVFIASTANVLVIDDFEYEDSQSAQAIWRSPSGCLPVETIDLKESKKALLLRCDLSKRQDRCYWDRAVSLDLSSVGTFSFWIAVENPKSISYGTLYFQSGDGWFSGMFNIGEAKWHKVSIRKSSFSMEGSPSGWHFINRIRLSFWKAADIDTSVMIDNLCATTSSVAIVMGGHRDRSQAITARNATDTVAKLFERNGIDFSILTSAEVETKALSSYKLAIFPYNPDMSTAEIDQIVRFVETGGKIISFYLLPKELSQLLGIRGSRWERESYPGEFFSISLDSKFIGGLPESVHQGSWNVTIPDVDNNEAKVIGVWVDANGKSSSKPAVVLNRNGSFVGHILTQSDLDDKAQMLLALIGELLPDMRNTLARAIVESVGRVGGLDDIDEVMEQLKGNIELISDKQREKVSKELSDFERLLTSAKSALEGDRYGEVLELSRLATEKLRQTFIMSFPSREDEFRGMWCHSAFGIPNWSWDKAIENLKKNNFTAIVPNMLWGGLAYYPSEVLPVDKSVEKEGDQIQQCLSACRKHGIQVHIWKVNWNLSNAPAEFVQKMKDEGRLQKDRYGNDIRWLCPSNEKNYKLELESMLEIVRKYDVDGIHFDYIRYPDANSCYCPNCKSEFEKSIGDKVENFPEDVINGKYSEKYTKWRSEMITRLVRDVSKMAREINPKVKISAAVFSDYPNCVKDVGQDWKLWIDSGYLDFVCPMNYTDNNERFKNMVSNQINIVNKRIPLYPGIGASAPGLSADQVAMQIHLARTSGAKGFIIFNYDLTVATDVVPSISPMFEP